MAKGNKYTRIIELFIKDSKISEIQFLGDKTFWPREIKILKSLMSLYPEEDFWYSMAMDFKLNSMAFFKTPDGSKTISQRYGLYKMEVKTEVLSIELFGEKIGEDIEIKQNKNKSIKSFLT